MESKRFPVRGAYLLVSVLEPVLGSIEMTISGLEIDALALEQLCRRHRIRRLSLFGSRARGEAVPESDIDLLVEFEQGSRVGLRLITVQDELSAFFGLPVDLCTEGFLSPHFRGRVVREAISLYAAA